MSDLEDRPARSVALDAVIRIAVEKSDSSLYRYQQRFTSDDVLDRADADISKRTVRRALKDGEALGWVKKPKHANEWKSGRRAKEIAGEIE